MASVGRLLLAAWIAGAIPIACGRDNGGLLRAYPATGAVSSGGFGSSEGSGGVSAGGVSGGGAHVGGAAGALTKPSELTAEGLLVAFIGDQGNGADADAVLRLIADEGADAVVHNGDFDYVNSPASFEARVNSILGENFPYFAVIGNHDAAAWAGAGGYGERVAARVARVPEMKCTGEIGVHANCSFRGLQLLQSCVGTSELRASCQKDSPTEVEFLKTELTKSRALWKVCNWHKNQRSLQVGLKTDEVGYLAYQECMKAGALVATGHEHSYARTFTLTDVGNLASGHGFQGIPDRVLLGPGKNFVFVSGLGGASIRNFDAALHSGDAWWGSWYAANGWVKNGVTEQGIGTFGALFIQFYVDGNPRKARAWFKDIHGRVADSFGLTVEPSSE